MKLWADGCYFALIDDTELEAQGGAACLPKDNEAAAQAFDNPVLSGHLRQAVRRLVSQDRGGVYKVDNLCMKTGKLVLEVLQAKHPALRNPRV